MAPLSTLREILIHLIDPWLFLSSAASHVPSTIRRLITTGKWAALLTPWGFSEAVFSNFWVSIGPQVKQSAEKRVSPLLEGRIQDGRVLEHAAGLPMSGTVIEVGAGSGMWLDVYSNLRKRARHSDGLRNRDGGRPDNSLVKIYGVEPNSQSAAALRQRVQEIGIEDIYEVLPVGVESLSDICGHSKTIEHGSVDCIVSILSLCSIPDQEKNIKELYKLLKPGGRWYVYEHVKVSRGGILLALYQRR